jgi:hypothetical protein
MFCTALHLPPSNTHIYTLCPTCYKTAITAISTVRFLLREQIFCSAHTKINYKKLPYEMRNLLC